MLLSRVVTGALAVAPLVSAAANSLYTSSVSYCAPPSALLVQKFDVRFFRANSSVVFAITAESTRPANLTGAIAVNAYGIKPINISFNLCDLGSFLCPIPQYTFNGSGTIPVPKQYISNIPSIAYGVPDLEAYAQLTLFDTSKNHNQVACVQTTLSNGLTTRQKAVSWTTGAIAIFITIAGLVFTLLNISRDDGSYVNDDRTLNPLPWRGVEYLLMIQHIVLTGLLNLNYPLVYSAFTANFAWSFGLFSMGRTSPIQQSINNLRLLTGADTNSSAVNPIAYVNRKTSPYNSRRSFDLSFLAANNGGVSNVAGGSTPVVSADNELPAGIPTYVNWLGIGTQNAYMSVYFSALILIAIALVVFAIGYGVLFVMDRRQTVRSKMESRVSKLKRGYASFVMTTSVRLALIMFLPIIAFAFYEWTIHDSWLPVFLSVILLLWIWAVLAYAAFVAFRAYRSSSLHEAPTFHFIGALYEPYRTARWWFTLVPGIPALFLKGVFVGLVPDNGWVQVIGLLVIEVILLISLCVAKPYLARRADALAIWLGVVRVASLGLLIAFEASVGVKPIPRVAIGFVILVVLSVGVLTLVMNLFWHFGAEVIRAVKYRRGGATGEVKAKGVGKEEEEGVASPDSTYPISRPFAGPASPEAPQAQSPWSATTPIDESPHASGAKPRAF